MQIPVQNAWRPVAPPAWRPAPARMPGKQMGQAGAVLALGAVPVLFGAAMGAGLSWVGFTTGARERGLLSILGYVFGVTGAISAVTGVLGGLLLLTGAALVPERETRMEV